MGKKITAEMTYDATCDQVFAMFRDPGYVAEKLKGTGGFDPEISVTEEGSDVVVDANRSLPAQVPGFMKALTGDSVRVAEAQRWSPADDLGARTAHTTLNFEGTPGSAAGTLNLHPKGDGAVLEVNLEVTASVPLIGGKIEGVIADQIARAVRQENKIGVAWLNEH